MATNKQCGMLTARAKAAGMPLEWDTCKKMQNGEVDDMLAEIAKFAADGKAVGTKAEPQQNAAFDGNNFGIALKSVLHYMNERNENLPENKAVETVLDRYDLAQKAREAVNSASSGA